MEKKVLVIVLTHKETGNVYIHFERHVLMLLKHQANIIHSADKIFIVLDQFHRELLHL